MNDPVGGKNPGGGINWADRRAKAGGHPRPYDVQRWEVGNESHVAPFRYDFAVGVSKQVEQYAEGGVRTIGGESTNTEKLGRDCAHPGDGKPATGRRYQEFETLYTPVHRVDAVRVGERTRPWRQVSQQQLSHPVRNDLEGKRVFAVDKVAGRIIFGTVEPSLTADQRPVVPAEGDIVTADYTNRFQGFFAFARAMHAVDPDIKVCATWGTPLFAQQYGRRDYDCSSAHPLTNFSKAPAREWAGPLEGHDRMMLGLAERRADVRALQAAQPDRTPLWLTEFQAIHGYGRAFPGWSASVSNAVYMSAQWATWLEMGIPWGNGGDLLGRGVGSVFGQPNGNFVFSAEAHARETISPMFQAGGQVVASSVKRNPQREPQLRNAGAYGALTVVASRGRRGELYLLVVNKLPTKDVKTTVRMAGFRARGTATVRRVAGKSFQQFNKPGKPGTVAMQRSERRVQRDSFTATFPAHSVTVVRMPRR